MVARGIGALETAVVSVGSFRGGAANNVIPDSVTLLGTIRSLSPSTRDRVHARIREVVEGVAAGLGVTHELAIEPEYPVLVNDPDCAATVARVAADLDADLAPSGEGLPLLASEDFAYFAQVVPSAYFFLGAGVPGAATPGCHHPDFDFDDDLIERGVRIFVGIVTDRIRSLRVGQ